MHLKLNLSIYTSLKITICLSKSQITHPGTPPLETDAKYKILNHRGLPIQDKKAFNQDRLNYNAKYRQWIRYAAKNNLLLDQPLSTNSEIVEDSNEDENENFFDPSHFNNLDSADIFEIHFDQDEEYDRIKEEINKEEEEKDEEGEYEEEKEAHLVDIRTLSKDQPLQPLNHFNGGDVILTNMELQEQVSLAENQGMFNGLDFLHWDNVW